MEIQGGDWIIRTTGEECGGDLLAVYADCEDFLALGPVAKASPEMVRADLRSSQSEGGEFCGIYLPSGPIAGVLDFVPKNFRGQRDTAFIALLMLRPSFRHQGIGPRVLELIETEIRKDPVVSRIRIGVQVNNPLAIRFWQNHGFQIYSGPESIADQTTVYRLEKKFPLTGNGQGENRQD
jgi:ribosomal protein S18 acetylase RimI-like enzyme